MSDAVNMKEIAWSMIQDDSKFDKSSLMKSMLLERRADKANEALGPALPYALRPGQEAIESPILMEPGEALEHTTKILDLKG